MGVSTNRKKKRETEKKMFRVGGKTLASLLGMNVTPLWNNICCALLTVIYVKVVMDIASVFRERYGKADESRKFVHIAAASWIMFWPMFDATHWSWRLNVLVPAVMGLKLFYKGAILADPNDEDVRNLSRSSSPSELLYGPLQFTMLMVWLGLYKFMTEEAAIMMAALGIGDGIAPIIGTRYGRHIYRMPLGNTKTLEGTIGGVFLGTIFGCYLYLHVLGFPILPLRIVLSLGGIAAVVEGSSPGNFDNITLTAALHLTIERVKELMLRS